MIDLDLEESVNYIMQQIPNSLDKSDKEKECLEQELQMQKGIKNYRTMMMFSATMIPQIEKLARTHLKCPAYISVGEPGSGKKDIDQYVEFVSSESQRRQRVQDLLNKYPNPPIIIFVNQKTDVESLTNFLTKIGFNAAALHGSKAQDKREEALNALKSGDANILVCTNVAARGLDVEGVTHVINYHAPNTIVDYVHRIGRTGRAGRKGMATTFLMASDAAIFYDLKKFLTDNGQAVPRELENHESSKVKPVGQEGGYNKSDKAGKTVPTHTQENRFK